MTLRAAAVIAIGASAGLVALTTPRPAAIAAGRTQQPDSRQTYSGTWSASGARETLPAAGGRVAVTVHLSGSVVLTGETALGRGVRGEVIGYDNGAGLAAGSAVWTDNRGDQIFSDVTGDLLQARRRVTGTITGGTGRFAGATGGYELTWLYVVAGEGESVQGRATDLRGWIRLREPS